MRYTGIKFKNFYMVYEISYVTITKALLIVYFTLLSKLINLKMAHNWSRNVVERNNARNTPQ